MGEAAKRYTTSGIEYRWRQQPEVHRETFARNANQLTELLITKWADSWLLKADIMESAKYDATKKHLVRTTPMAHPEAGWLYLTSMVSQKPFLGTKASDPGFKPQFDPVTGLWAYDRLEYLCTFTNLPYKVLSDDKVKDKNVPELERYVVVTPTPIGSNRIVTSQPLFADMGGGTKESIFEPSAKPEIMTRYQVKLFMWPVEAIPWDIINERMGKVNSAEFTLKGIVNPIGSLLYEGLGASAEEYTGTDGKKYVDITHILTRHPVSWNKTYWKGAWRDLQVGTDAPPKRRYEATTFSQIFIPKQVP
jgi:hypothetical protein